MTETTVQGPFTKTIKRFQQTISDMKRWREETDDEMFKKTLTEFLDTYERQLQVLIEANK